MRTPKPPGKVGSKVESKRRSKLLEPPKEPPRPKTHWDHVLEEMAWLAKDFESERKWKLSHAKRVAHKVIRNGVDQASREELRLKEEEQRVRRLAGNIAKEVRKFWMKIEKLVHYKHQRDLEERRKRARDKQLNFLLGQTERYSTMLAENLVEKSQMLEPSKEPIENCQNKPLETDACLELAGPSLDDQLEEDAVCKEASFTYLPGETRTNADSEDEFSLGSTGDMEDDEATLEADEALITEDERNAELTALKDECDLPLEEILKRYAQAGDTGEATDSEGNSEEYDEYSEENCSENDKEKCTQATSYLDLPQSELRNEAELIETENAVAEEMKPEFNINDDEVKTEDSSREIHLLVDLTEGDQAEVQTCRELASETRTADEPCVSNDAGEIYESVPDNYQSIEDNFFLLESENELDDGEYTSAAVAGEDEDDEATLLEEEELAEVEGNDVTAEIDALKAESELPVEILVQRYRRTDCLDSGKSDSQDEKKPDFESVEALPVDMANDTKENEGKLLLIPEEDNHGKISEVKQKSHQTDLPHEIEEEESNDVKIADAAAAARLAQPTGNTFSTTKVRTKLPFLLKHPLREYQHIGLDWLVTMYEKRLNGILADEMGLGKTIMTIALLAHLACEKGIWGPHLIVVPTSVMLNWETEFMKWCPAFKVLTYFGSAKERKVKRQGWAKLNSFHVCITTYRLVIQDAKAFKRKKWKYLILDEAHLIKNWKSQRWQTLLNFNSKRRILLTGTPLQNDLMELWSLMHFLMPHLFQSQQEFKDWFSNPIAGMVERQEQVNKEVVDRLHNVLRPFILRRLKQDVEKQLPKKYEHVIACKLSKRQRNLYEDFIASSETQATLASGNFLGLINVLMQLRKVCNHPDLFEGRPIVSSFDMIGSEKQVHPSLCSVLGNSQQQGINLVGMNLVFTHLEFRMSTWEYDEVSKIATPSALIQEIRPFHRQEPMHRRNIFEEIQQALHDERVRQARARAMLLAWLNSFRCKRKPVYGMDLRKAVTIEHPVFDIHKKNENPAHYLETSSLLADLVLSPSQRCRKMLDMIESFVFAIPASRAPQPVFWCSKSASSALLLPPPLEESTAEQISNLLEPLRPVIVRRQLFFPDRRLIQFDCGKLQELAILLRRLKSEGHRALIFTQMTKMLDVLEAFINLYGYTYVRLDGSTQPEERQILMQRFNTNPKIFLFILSTRSGGVGINLVGADTVIFYDSDWNPAMDQQAQDRCHRIGQTREVHIYRLVSEKTIEENILKKANQKRALDDLVIQSGGYNTEFFKKLNPMDLFSGLQGMRPKKIAPDGSDPGNEDDQLLSNDDLEAALKNAEDEADYMALKKVELEDAAHDQEFTEDVVTRLLEDDEYGIEPDEGKSDAKKAQDDYEQTENRAEKLLHSTENEFTDNNTALHPVDSEIEMMVDVQQMGTGAGNGALSFQDRLLPVEKYAIQFLEEWDPIVDKAALESQMRFEEAEWELDRLEKMKEEQEAEIDEDDEPLLYESWDTEFANETYRQQVEVLAQQQLLQDQLEWDSEEAAALDDDGGEARRALKQKARHKLKKTKFKSLKRGNLALNEDQVNDKMSAENNFSESGDLHGSITAQRKRKALKLFEDEVLQGSHLKKMRKKHATGDLELMDIDDLGDGHGDALQNELFGSTSRGGKIIISDTPTKKVAIIKLDNRKKKSSRKDKNRLPSPDKWSTSEDAILCAIVHEYGINWELASFILYGITSGGMYRGRYRHPIHCRERFGELFLTFISSATAESNSEKANMSLKTLLRVTEEHVKKLFDVVQELPDNDFLLQRHFAAVLSSVSRHRGATRTKTQDRLVSNGHPVTSSSHSISVQNNLLNGHWVTDQNDSWLRSTPQLAVRNGSGESRAADLVGAALQETREETKDPLSKKATSSDGISDPACTSGIGPISVSSTDQLLIDLKFEQPSVFSDNRDQSVTVVVYRADNLSEDRSEDIVKESAYAGNFIRSREDMIPAVEPHSLGKHSPPTELVKPAPKKPRLLDLNQMISEADAGLLDLTVGEADSDVIEDAVPDDRTHLLSELRNIMNPEFEESFSENRDYDFAGFMTASMEPSVSYSKREIIPDLPDIF